MQKISVVTRPKAALFLIVLILAVSGPAFGSFNIGVYYYPGWSPETGVYKPDGWPPIKNYPEREPLLGWYNENDVDTVNQHLTWMADYGIGFVAFCWYWYKPHAPEPETAVRAYLKAPAKSRIPYTLLWANHFPYPTTLAEWDNIVKFWLDEHMKNPEYLRIDGKPALFVFSTDHLRDQAWKIIYGTGTPTHDENINATKALLDRARDAANKAGLNGIYFVLCTLASMYWVNFAEEAGFDALSAYNYRLGMEGDERGTVTPYSHSFTELDAYYRMHWNWILKNSRMPYFVPMISGWDKRPWGGSSDPLHDNSSSTPQEFETHLRAGYDTIIRHATRTKGIGILYAWNEYGEGGIIEPTKRHGLEYLRLVQKVFPK